ncbi:MAG: hypothetical protein WD772_01040 [Pseudohongiellaceae bacterium]
MRRTVIQRVPRSSARLNKQIRELDWQLHRRRKALLQHRTALNEEIRAKLRSPVTTVIALALGFVLGNSHVLRKHGSKISVPAAGTSPGKLQRSATLLMRINSALTILNALLAVTARMDHSAAVKPDVAQATKIQPAEVQPAEVRPTTAESA